MSRIVTVFNELKGRGEKAFIPFLMSGDPNLEMTKKLVLTAEKSGADIIELGMPYATPLADGPTIRKASQRSLIHNTNLLDIFELVKEIRKESNIPLILMGYYNTVFSFGIERFVLRCEEVGVDGVIIPDLPLGEDKELREYSNKLEVISLITTLTKEARIKEIAQSSSGFIYAVSRPGVTGAREELSLEIKEVVEQLKSLTDTPVAVGFGISNSKQSAEVGEFADGVIVGSAIIKRIENNLDLIEDNKEEFLSKIGDFIASLKKPLR